MITFGADALTRLGRVGAIAPHPDGAWLAVVVQRLAADAAWASELWRVPLDGGPAQALTRGLSMDTSPRFRADGALLFLSDRRDPAAVKAADDDGKRTQVWMLPPSGGEPVPITDEPLGVAAYAVAREDTLALLVEVWPGVGQTPYDGNPAQFVRHSPHAFVGRWTTPTLVMHGEKDYRVPISEALLLYEALGQHRVPAELLVFPDENHWIVKPRNIRAWYAARLDFVGRHLDG